MPAGYTVSLVEFEGGEPKEPRNSNTSLMNIMWNSNITGCPQKCFRQVEIFAGHFHQQLLIRIHRPVGIAFDSVGRAWVASDSTGEIYIITPPGSSLSGLPSPNDTSSGGSNSRRRSSAAASLAHNGVSFVQITVGVVVVCILLGGWSVLL